uniref:Neuroligin-4, X-linked n=1 Tax=Anthurium amnicola TaxID=1678845 RepID=A0A1D1XK83_9ARAE
MALPRGSTCPPNAFLYNGTRCACNPGYYLSSRNGCTLLRVAPDGGDWVVHAGVGSSPTFLMTIFSFDSIKRFTRSQAIFLETTLVLLVAWLSFCIALRCFGRLDRGRSIWFRIRWWISRFDVCYSTKHWLEDNKLVVKRRTELGGTLSVASWILFIGLLSALLYQVIAKRNIEVHRIRPANAPDLIAFVNDMEFNLTTVSSMSCSHLRGLDTLVTGTPGLMDYRTSHLSTYADYYCQNTSKGPTISLKCSSCQVPRGSYFISWQFVDLPNDPAMAVGFEFNLTAKDHTDGKRVSYVSGIVNSGSYIRDKLKTFRGRETNIFKIHLFPQIYHNLHNLRLIQPLLHDFVPGSSFSEAGELRTSLQNSGDGLINTTLYIRFLSDYIVEINNESVLGPVSFLADVGGLYAISMAIFMYILFQCERRIKILRNEDSVMRAIRSRQRAQLNWDKVRKYVMYTWGPSNLDETNMSTIREHGNAMIGSFRGIGSLHKPKLSARMDSIYLDKKGITPTETNVLPERPHAERVIGSASDTNVKEKPPHLESPHVSGHEICSIQEENVRLNTSCKQDYSEPQLHGSDKRTQLPFGVNEMVAPVKLG